MIAIELEQRLGHGLLGGVVPGCVEVGLLLGLPGGGGRLEGARDVGDIPLQRVRAPGHRRRVGHPAAAGSLAVWGGGNGGRGMISVIRQVPLRHRQVRRPLQRDHGSLAARHDLRHPPTGSLQHDVPVG